MNFPAVYLHHKKANKHKNRNYQINKNAIQLLFNWMMVQKRIVKKKVYKIKIHQIKVNHKNAL